MEDRALLGLVRAITMCIGSPIYLTRAAIFVGKFKRVKELDLDEEEEEEEEKEEEQEEEEEEEDRGAHALGKCVGV